MATQARRLNRVLALCAMSGVAVAVAGCNGFPFAQPAATAPAESVNLPPPPPRKPPPPAPAAAVARLPEPTPGAEQDSPVTGFDRLYGLDQPKLIALLGEPRQRAEAPPATIWRYAGQGCELDVYLYFDLQSRAMRALHYEVRSHEPGEQPAQQCYDELVRDRRAHADPASGTDHPR